MLGEQLDSIINSFATETAEESLGVVMALPILHKELQKISLKLKFWVKSVNDKKEENKK